MSSSLYLDLNEELPDVAKEEKEFSKAESDYKKGLLSDTMFEDTCQKLTPIIEKDTIIDSLEKLVSSVL